jgi:hypothetical protein
MKVIYIEANIPSTNPGLGQYDFRIKQIALKGAGLLLRETETELELVLFATEEKTSPHLKIFKELIKVRKDFEVDEKITNYCNDRHPNYPELSCKLMPGHESGHHKDGLQRWVRRELSEDEGRARAFQLCKELGWGDPSTMKQQMSRCLGFTIDTRKRGYVSASQWGKFIRYCEREQLSRTK